MQHGDLYFYWNGRSVTYGTLDDHLNEVLIDNTSIKYLHQLQNIFFVFTGKEININF